MIWNKKIKELVLGKWIMLKADLNSTILPKHHLLQGVNGKRYFTLICILSKNVMLDNQFLFPIMSAYSTTFISYITCVVRRKIPTQITLKRIWRVMANVNFVIGTEIVHVNVWAIYLCIWDSQYCLYNTESKSDWQFNTWSRVLQAEWLIFKNDENATFKMPNCTKQRCLHYIC